MLAIATPFIPPTFDGRRTVPSPEVTEIMADLLHLGPQDKLLEIGTGSGFQCSHWALSGCEVHSIELEPFVDPTKITGDCVFLHSGDGIKGLPQEAPFTAIVATCGVEKIPQAWIDQLAVGGRMVVPIGDSTVQRLTLYHKFANAFMPVRIAAYVRFSMLESK